jgi:replicative DNA helicase
MANQGKEIEESFTDLVLNPGSERNLISICLKNEDKIMDVEGAEIFAEHFGVPAHKYVFMAMMYLFSKKIKPTPMAIMEVLSNDKAKKAVEEIGGLEYLTLLEESSIPPGNLDIFIAKIKQSYTRRVLFNIGTELRDFVVSEKAEVLNPSELVSFVETRITDLSVNSTQADEVYKMGDETENVLTERAEKPNTVPGLETGMTDFDRYTNGGQPGDLVVICAESKTGKSVLLTNWARKLSIQDQIPSLYIDSEMSHREQEDRLLSNITGIPHSEIVSGMYVMDTENGTAEEKIAKLKEARENLKLGHYYHIYMPQFTIEKVTALARKFQMQFGIKALFFDYIKIPSNQANFRSVQEYQALGFFTSGLKDIAGILQIPVYTACQANRSDLGSSEKDASAIGGSYRILQLATKLIFLTNKSDEQIAKQGVQNGNQTLTIKYQRNGMSDCPPINLFFNRPILRMQEV